MNNVVISAIFSIIVQFIAGVFLVLGFFFKLKPEDEILKTILTMELVVQVVEFLMYFVLIYFFIQGNIDTKLRYFDWFISTPIMLLATYLFLKYLYEKPLDAKESFEEDKLDVSGIVILNFLMLFVGYLTENGMLNRWVSFILGSGFLVGSFGILGKYASKTKYGTIFLSIMFGIWAFYGVAFMFPRNMKNIIYNILDLFAKNFYGVFLYIIIKKKYK